MSRSTVEDAYIALAMIWGLRDPSTSPHYPWLDTCYKRASSAIMTLRSLDVRVEHHVQPCLALGVSLVTFALKLGGTHVLPICNHILSLVKPYYEAGKQLVDPDLLIAISLNEIAECLMCARMPTLLVELPQDQAESYVSRYIGLSANILPYLFHICKISAEMAHGDPVDKDKTLNRLEEEIRRWQPSIHDRRMSEFTATEVSHMICQASTMQTAALLVIHRLRYPYGIEDLAASAMASSILSQIQMTHKITGRAPRCVDLPLIVACTEIPDELGRTRYLRTLSSIAMFSLLFQKRVQSMLASFWEARTSSTTLYWCDLAASLS
ncbi:hypothetical protein J3458_003337 [Metarhizium acridum]|uniref:uncharacterized protein n=1 Tax=Metarhizium acridum TaxID=92637 RepID=UPI001C6BCE31|nr:hypothetical protein J3458_003337 [Metarhizium acridum]